MTPHSKKVLELLLAGKPEEAERYIATTFDLQLNDLQRRIQLLGHERALLMNTVLLAKISSSPNAAPQTPPPLAVVLDAAATRRKRILDTALEVAKKNKHGQVVVQEVVDALKAQGFDLQTDSPNTSVGVMLHRSEEWERVSPAVFRYVGAKLDLRANK